MATQTSEQFLEQLDALKTQFGSRPARSIAIALRRLDRVNVDDAGSLLRLHELLLFIRAYPHNASVLKLADAALRSIPRKLSRLLDIGVDLAELVHPDSSGIAGTEVIDTFSFQIVRWLQEKRATQTSIYWEWFEDENRLAEVWPRFLPLLEDDSFVEANVPYREWLRNARGSHPEVSWLIARFNHLKLAEVDRAQLYNAQKLYVRWQFNYRDSRTGLRLRPKKTFCHEGPLIQRREINLKAELRKPIEPLQKLSKAEGHLAIDMARVASTVRYRELYGFTHGDPRSVFRIAIGRGVELVLISLPPEKRLPLRGYHSAMIYKNGVPVGYFEGLSLFERMESGFNLYYTFREGETAWLYARILNVMHKWIGVSAFSLDPYQIGFENEEGIESGAFWFYRKLGFRSTSTTIQKLTEHEEEKIASRKSYRTSAVMLRRLAEAPMILEMEETRKGDWDKFQIRTIGMAVQRLLARKFNGDANKMRTNTSNSLRQNLAVDQVRFSSLQKVIGDFSTFLSLAPDLETWSQNEKRLLGEIIEAKSSGSERRFLRLMQKHHRLRELVIRLGQ